MLNVNMNTDTDIIIDANESEDEIEKAVELADGQIFMMGDKPSRMNPEPRIKYTGKILGKQDNTLILGVCVATNQTLEYKDDDVVDISYIELKSLYSFNAKILGIKKVSQADDFDIYDMINELGSVYGFNKYIFEVLPLTGPEKHQRREFYRLPFGIEIYYKSINADRIEHITDGDLKFEIEHGKEMKEIADGGMFEIGGYMKLTTMDMSAGGFKFKSEIKIEAESFLECILLIEEEALPVIVQILSSNPDMDDSPLYDYDIRASFYKISDTVRDRILKFIFHRERQDHSRFMRNKI